MGMSFTHKFDFNRVAHALGQAGQVFNRWR